MLTDDEIRAIGDLIPDDYRPPLVETVDPPDVEPWAGPSLVAGTWGKRNDIDAIGGIATWNFCSKRFHHFTTHENFVRYVLSLQPQLRTFNELIGEKQHQKLRLDIDSKTCSLSRDDISDIIARMLVVFEEMFGDILLREHIYACDSTRAGKQSLHLIVDKFCVRGCEVASNFADKVREGLPKRLSECIDGAIYHRGAGLRAAYNHKGDTTGTKRIPRGVDAANILITNVENCRVVEPRVQICKTVTDYDEIVPSAVDEYVAEILAVIPGFRFRNVRGGSINFNRTEPSTCHISGRMHTHDNTLHAAAIDGKLIAKCRHCPGSLVICELGVSDIKRAPAPVRKKVKTPMETRAASEARIKSLCDREYPHRKLTSEGIITYEGKMNIHGDYMDEYPDPPTLHVKATMGCGKTEALRRHIAKIKPKSVLVVSHRVSFTIDICAKLGYASYQTIDGEINTKTAPFVVVQCESLHRVSSQHYEMVICDEIESILAQMFAPTHRRANICWRIFESLVKFCDRLITMDGNLSQETIDVITMIREDRAEVVVNTAIPTLYKHKITTNKEAAVAVLMSLIRRGDRVAVPTSSRTFAQKLQKMITEKYPDKPVRIYTSETSAEEREATLRDVNASWRECTVLIYTPTISSGVSFTIHHFDSLVGFWFDGSCDVFTVMQMSRRPRHISTGTFIHFVAETGHKLPDTVESLREYVSASVVHACEYMEDPDAELMPDGKLDFKDTPRFRAWLTIHARRNHSQTHFLESLIREIKLIGGVVEPLVTSFEGNIVIEKVVRTQLRAIGEDITRESATAVSESPELTVEEIDYLQRGIAPKNCASIQKYYLRKCYNYSGEVTPEIAQTYGSMQLKMQYHARRNLRTVHDEVFNDPDSAVKILGKRFCNVMIADFASADGREVDNLRKLFEFNRDSICVKILSIFGLRIGDTKLLPREDVLKALVTSGHKWLATNCKHICETFGVKVVQLPTADDKNYLKYILEFINGKLKSRYGVLIKLVSKNSTNYHLEDSLAKLFNDDMKIPEPVKI
jgi:hypothetical protein